MEKQTEFQSRSSTTTTTTTSKQDVYNGNRPGWMFSFEKEGKKEGKKKKGQPR
jgi:hypothetical protein